MNRKTVLTIFVLFMFMNITAPAQVFDYRHVESPAISWNGTGMYDAGLLSLGGVSLFASGPASQVANPALYPKSRGVELGFSYSYVSYQSFQYWGVNTGVLATSDPFREGLGFPSMITARFGFPGISMTAGWYRSALNDFPDFSIRNEYDYDQYDEFNGTFSGFTESFFMAAGIPISGKLSAGVKVRYSRGARNAAITDKTSYYYFLDGYWQLKEKISTTAESERTEIFAPEAGIIYKLNKNWSASARIMIPLTGKAKRVINRSLSNNDGLNIYDDHEFTDDFFDVPELSTGILFSKGGLKIFGSPGKLRAGAEISFKKWSDYKLYYYGEEEVRDPADTVKLALGAEYGMQLKKMDLFLRLGFNLDKQPRRDVETVLSHYSAGAGILYQGVEFGIGFLYTRGSAGGVMQDHFTICTSLSKIL